MTSSFAGSGILFKGGNNMWSIINELLSVSKELKIEVNILSAEITAEYFAKIEKKYLLDNYQFFLWDGLSNYSVLNDSSGWRYIGQFIGDKPCILFFYDLEKWKAAVINSGHELVSLIGEMYGFEFYVFDSSINYLICFNHHDQLMGVGSAKEWVNNLQEGSTPHA